MIFDFVGLIGFRDPKILDSIWFKYLPLTENDFYSSNIIFLMFVLFIFQTFTVTGELLWLDNFLNKIIDI